MQRALEAAMAELVLGPSVGDVDAFLARHEFTREDRAALRADFERLLVYRQLVRGTLRDAVELAIPRTLARLGGLFDEYFELFLNERGPATHYLRDVTEEFLAFCAPRWRADARVPEWALDLARHEALQIVVSSLQRSFAPLEREPGEIALERGLRFVEAVRVARYAFAVHRLTSDENDRTPPERAPTALCVYRDPEHDVRYLELSPLAAAILERLLAGATLKDAVLAACSESGTDPAAALESTARFLADLAARGVLLGVAPPAGTAVTAPVAEADGAASNGDGNLLAERENSTMPGCDKEPHERS